jgi:hypothetical protein
MLSSKHPKSFHPGDRVIFSVARRSPNPAHGAKDVRPERKGDAYQYIVEDFLIVANTRGGQIVVKTRQGGIHVLDTDDDRVHVASWWQRLIYRHQFPKPASGTPPRNLHA